MDWDKDISNSAKGTMKFLGDFGPTVHAQNREVKGYMHDDEGGGKVYLDAGELREIAASCNEVADWLDKRADAVPNAQVHGLATVPCSAPLEPYKEQR